MKIIVKCLLYFSAHLKCFLVVFPFHDSASLSCSWNIFLTLESSLSLQFHEDKEKETSNLNYLAKILTLNVLFQNYWIGNKIH